MEKSDANTSTSLKKVVIIGPECTGKSTLSSRLADYYHTLWVPEYARQYIDELERPYRQSDLLKIARGQIALEDKKAKESKHLLLCDTDLIVLKVWSEFKYGSCPDEILQEIKTRKYDLYLLTYIDIPWEDDPQRENPEQRVQLYNIFKNELEQLGVTYVEVKGEWPERQKVAVRAIDNLFDV